MHHLLVWEHRRTQQIILKQNGREWCKLTQSVPTKVYHLRTKFHYAAQEIMQTRIWSQSAMKKVIEVSSYSLQSFYNSTLFWVVLHHGISLLTPLSAVLYCQVTIHSGFAVLHMQDVLHTWSSQNKLVHISILQNTFKNVSHLCTEISFTLELLSFHADACRCGHRYT